MAGGSHPVTTLLDVAAACARQRAAGLDLFEQLGAWVLDSPPGPDQRRWATAGHRHAWHADLWARRAPAIRPFDLDTAVAADRGRLGAPATPAERPTWYAATLGHLISEVEQLAAGVDPQLDPSTARTCDLVLADLRRLAAD